MRCRRFISDLVVAASLIKSVDASLNLIWFCSFVHDSGLTRMFSYKRPQTTNLSSTVLAAPSHYQLFQIVFTVSDSNTVHRSKLDRLTCLNEIPCEHVHGHKHTKMTNWNGYLPSGSTVGMHKSSVCVALSRCRTEYVVARWL